MLLGTYYGVISPKRRVAIPKKFRQLLGEKVYLAKWYEGCLVLVSSGNWKALLNKLTGRAKFITQSVRDTDRFILASAYDVIPDGQGRVVIPEGLAEYAVLGSEVIFLGLGDRVEVWNRKVWEEKEKSISKMAAEVIEKLAGEERGNA